MRLREPTASEAGRSLGPSRRARPVSRPLAGNPISLTLRLAESALCEIWRVDRAGGETLALKRLKSEWRAHPGAVELILREHRLLSRLRHPRLIEARGLVQDDATHGLLLEYLSGGDLVPLAGSAPRHWIGAAAAVVDALAYLHRQGVVHGDVKARNVLFDAAGNAKLIDLGSAVPAGAPPTGPGSAAHQPPFALRTAGFELDVYQLAVLLYELMSGRLPFGAAPDRDAFARPLHPPLAVERTRGATGNRGLSALSAEVISVLSLARENRRLGGSLRAFSDVIESVTAAEGAGS